jgi:hypothetical protein
MIKLLECEKTCRAVHHCARCDTKGPAEYMSIAPTGWTSIEIRIKGKSFAWFLCPQCGDLITPALDLVAQSIFGGKHEA